MNAGFSNLSELKAYLLAASLRASTDYDTTVANIGKGVAALFENYCGRKFFRTAGAVEILPGDRAQFLLARFPIETLTSLALKTSEADGYVAQTINDIVRTIDLRSGVVYLTGDAGPYYALLKFTYTGGFFWDILEPTDLTYPTAVPAGATELPADLKLAWLNQCAEVWNKIDKLGTGINEKPDSASLLSALTLSPMTKSVIEQYARRAMV